LLEKPDAGDIVVDGVSAGGLNDKRRTALRRTTIGFVYQYHHLLPEFTALENVALPQMIAGKTIREAKRYAAELLERVGLTARADHRPGQLSGGEQQRVSIARGLVKNPPLMLADEPTGALDTETGTQVLSLLREITDSGDRTIIVVTHNTQISRIANRVIDLRDGEITGTHLSENPENPGDIAW
jgi:lipoprotein-releasing system ATP-binding protein